MARPLERDLLERLEAQLGPFSLSPIAGASQASVWKVESHSARFALKVYPNTGAASFERRVFSELGSSLGRWLPRCIATTEMALVLEWIPHAVDPSSADAHRQAGAFIRALEACPPPRDALRTDDAIAKRRVAWLARARPHLPAAWLEQIGSRLEPARFVDWPRVWAHRDFEPRHWRRRDDGSLAILDFGHARPDLRDWDRLKLMCGCWQQHPALEHAFNDGLGREVSKHDRAGLEQLVLLHGLQTATWGHEHNDDAFIALGRSILAARLDGVQGRASRVEARER